MNKTPLRELKTDIKTVLNKFSELEVICLNNQPVSLEGFLDIQDQYGESHGNFNIRISVPKNYPFGFPDLRELSRKIPRELDRHVYGSGNCCVTVPQQQMIDASVGISLGDYISRYVIPYLANQIYFEEFGEWANGEYSHGLKGHFEFYQDKLNLKTLDDIDKAFYVILKLKTLANKDRCFCGSKRKYMNCHRNTITEIRRISVRQLLKDYAIVCAFMAQKELFFAENEEDPVTR